MRDNRPTICRVLMQVFIYLVSTFEGVNRTNVVGKFVGELSRMGEDNYSIIHDQKLLEYIEKTK